MRPRSELQALLAVQIIATGFAGLRFLRQSHRNIGTLTDAHRDVIGKFAARYRLPAVYPFPFFVRSGGLISYGTDIIDLYRRAAGYVDRILKGEKPADLPVQQPTKIQLAINLKAAKALGLEVPPTSPDA
jgi:putative ABC transport system substrate-binding protein